MPDFLGLNLPVPVLLAPLGGGPGTPALAAAVSRSGGLGTVGSAYFTPEQLLAAAGDTRARTDRPFAMNLFVPALTPTFTPEEERAARAELHAWQAELNVEPVHLQAPYLEDFDAQFQAVLAARPAVLSFTFGQLGAAQLQALRARGIRTLGTATGLREALALEASGVDALILQGGGAGGHRGSWLDDERLGTTDLVRRVRPHVKLPLVAAGGLMTRQDVQAALSAGASLAALGTAFLLADEAGTHPSYRQALEGGGETGLTRAFTGRWARGLVNRAFHEIRHPLPTPAQHALTRPLRQAAAAAGRSELMSLWAGTGVNGARRGLAGSILAQLT